MPTLIRFLIFLLVLGALGFGGMMSLIWFVQPPTKDITITIPARTLLAAPTANEDPLDLGNLPDPVNIAPPDESSEPSAPAEGESSILEVGPGTPE